MIAYFTLLVGEHCSHMMINRTLEHEHHTVLMISSLLIVNALYPNLTLGVPHFSERKNQDSFQGFFRISNRYLGYVLTTQLNYFH